MSDQPLPDQAQGLGQPVAEYKGAAPSVLMTLIGGGVTVVIFIGIIVIQRAALSEMWQNLDGSTRLVFAGAMGLVFLIIGGSIAFQLLRAYLRRGLRVVLFPEGLLHTKAGVNTVIRWSDISSVWQAGTVYKMYGVVTMGRSHIYTIQTASGKKLVLSDLPNKGDPIAAVEALGTAIQEQVSKRMVPQALETLQMGGTLNFGKMAMTQQGLSKGRDLVPWSEIQSVTIDEGVVKIKKTGKWLGWASQKVAETPNLFVLLALVDQNTAANRLN